MQGNKVRLDAIDSVRRYARPPAFFPGPDGPGEIFGMNVFTKTVMQQRLPKAVFKSVIATIEHSKPLDPTVADIVASAMKDYPLTGLTAEKHDSGIVGLREVLVHTGVLPALDEAEHAATMLPAMGVVRSAADALEALVADDLWPLPTYQEMLFIL